jgi:hypothetical protein
VSGRRLLTLLLFLAVTGIPAIVLQATCVGASCDGDASQPARVPFCALPGSLRTAISDGFREGRSPDVLAVASGTPVFTDVGGLRLPWPATGIEVDARVPVALAGTGISAEADLPDGVTLDRLAPTMSAALAFERPHPEVRSGVEIPGVASPAGAAPRLVVLIAWKGVGSSELEARPREWPFLASLIDQGAGTLDAQTGSLPLDPAAAMATVGTGALPSQHGITGTFVRNDDAGSPNLGEVSRAFGQGAPVQVVATLADDLEDAHPRTLVGLVATDESDRGLVGGGWYPAQDPVDVSLGDAAAAPLVVQVHLETGYGFDDTTDVIGVALVGGIRRLDRWTREIVTAAQRATGGSVLVVVAGTGEPERAIDAVPDSVLVDAVESAVPGSRPTVEAVVPGGIFLDQETLTQAEVTGQATVDAILGVTDAQGRRMMADAFQGFAVSFARYC